MKLDKNNLERLSRIIFFHLNKLRILNLDDNNISKIEPDTFDDMKELEILLLSHNKLEEVELIDCFRNSSKIKAIGLCGNSFKTNVKGYLSGRKQLFKLFNFCLFF